MKQNVSENFSKQNLTGQLGQISKERKISQIQTVQNDRINKSGASLADQ
jgi:hypothetical protein